MQRLLNENEDLQEEIGQLQKELDVLIQQTLVEKKKKKAGKKGFRGGKGGKKGPIGNNDEVKVYKKTKELFNTFLSGKKSAGEDGLALIEKLKSPDKYKIDSEDTLGETVLFKAVHKNDQDLVKFLIAHHADLTHQDLEGETPLMIAAKTGNVAMVQFLLDELEGLNKLNKSINQVMKHSRKTALHLAAEKGFGKVALLLASREAKTSMRDINGKSARELAESEQHDNVVAVIEAAEAISSQHTQARNTRRNERRAQKQAADDDSDSDAEVIDSEDEEEEEEEDVTSDWQERQRLIEDYIKEHGILVNKGLENYIDGDFLDLDAPTNETGGRRMSYNDDEKMIEVREENSALKAEVRRYKLEIQDLKEKQNPDTWSKVQALPKGQREKLLNQDGRNAKKIAQQEDFHKLIEANDWEKAEQKYLLSKGVKITIDEVDAYGETALMKAAAKGNLDSVEILIQYDANVNLRDKAGDTALMKAAVHNQIGCANYLLDHNAALNHHTKHQRHTALHGAAMRGHGEMVELLITRGADIYAVDKNNKRPVDLAMGDALDVLEKKEDQIRERRRSTDPRELF